MYKNRAAMPKDQIEMLEKWMDHPRATESDKRYLRGVYARGKAMSGKEWNVYIEIKKAIQGRE